MRKDVDILEWFCYEIIPFVFAIAIVALFVGFGLSVARQHANQEAQAVASVVWCAETGDRAAMHQTLGDSLARDRLLVACVNEIATKPALADSAIRAHLWIPRP